MKLPRAVTGRYAKLGRDFWEGDILAIVDEAQLVMGEFMGKPRKQLICKVRVPKGEEMSLAINNTSRNKLMDAYGDDSMEWIGKRIKAWALTQPVQGVIKKVAYFTAPDQQLVEAEKAEEPTENSDELPEDWDKIEDEEK